MSHAPAAAPAGPWGALPLKRPYDGPPVSVASKRLAALMSTADLRAQAEYEQGPGRKAAAALAAGEICCSEEVKKERKKKSAYITRYRQKHYEGLLEEAVQEGEREVATQSQERARLATECEQLHKLYEALLQKVAAQQQYAAQAEAAAQQQMPLVKAEVSVDSQMGAAQEVLSNAAAASSPMDVTMGGAEVADSTQQNQRFAGFPFGGKQDNPGYDSWPGLFMTADEQAGIQDYYSSYCASEAA